MMILDIVNLKEKFKKASIPVVCVVAPAVADDNELASNGGGVSGP